ncbi:hypothetical protein Poli38472_010935 [Pythium oligandrum]|uniref:Uncharacterized protein n=1 Tax=Pythium oligandrum TaxID=41045 RepID=A0A8K1CGS8_PYTOL|nr:hypothetical protein Poli38472_010935 [Pythium oligandrum]|eukprot:TMW61872.1 hypothetical protein Poli38472_010935 [Pythium oligandrum]
MDADAKIVLREATVVWPSSSSSSSSSSDEAVIVAEEIDIYVASTSDSADVEILGGEEHVTILQIPFVGSTDDEEGADALTANAAAFEIDVDLEPEEVKNILDGLDTTGWTEVDEPVEPSTSQISVQHAAQPNQEPPKSLRESPQIDQIASPRQGWIDPNSMSNEENLAVLPAVIGFGFLLILIAWTSTRRTRRHAPERQDQWVDSVDIVESAYLEDAELMAAYR